MKLVKLVKGALSGRFGKTSELERLLDSKKLPADLNRDDLDQFINLCGPNPNPDENFGILPTLKAASMEQKIIMIGGTYACGRLKDAHLDHIAMAILREASHKQRAHVLSDTSNLQNLAYNHAAELRKMVSEMPLNLKRKVLSTYEAGKWLSIDQQTGNGSVLDSTIVDQIAAQAGMQAKHGWTQNYEPCPVNS